MGIINKSNLLVYNSRIDFLDSVMNNIHKFKQKVNDIKVIVADNTVNSYIKINSDPNMLMPVIKENEKTFGMLTWLDYEIKNRQEEYEKLGVENLEQYNDISKNKMPRYLIIFNDIIDFIRKSKEEDEDSWYSWSVLRDYISNYCFCGEKYGIRIIVSTKFDIKYIDLEDLNSFFLPIDYLEFKRILEKEIYLNDKMN